MPAEIKMTPAIHFTEEPIVDRCIKELSAMGIKANKTPIAQIKESELPDWAKESDVRTGWILFIEESKFNDGMNKVGEICGYTPD